MIYVLFKPVYNFKMYFNYETMILLNILFLLDFIIPRLRVHPLSSVMLTCRVPAPYKPAGVQRRYLCRLA